MRLQGNSLMFFLLVVGVCTTTAMVLHAPMACAGTIEIDSFDAPAGGENFASIDLGQLPTFVGAQPVVPSASGEASILGGDRNVTVQVATPVDWKSAMGTIGDGAFSLYTGGSAGSKTTIEYPGLTDFDLTDSGTNQAIALAFNFVDPGDMSLEITVDNNGSPATFMGNIPESASPFIYLAPLSGFDQEALLTGADGISFVLNGPQVANMDFELTSISVVEAVPEPSTIAMLLAVGLVSLLAFVRRR